MKDKNFDKWLQELSPTEMGVFLIAIVAVVFIGSGIFYGLMALK